MCKQKINVGLLLCSLSFGQAFGLEPELRQLTRVLNDLSGVLQVGYIPLIDPNIPLPPRVSLGTNIPDFGTLPPAPDVAPAPPARDDLFLDIDYGTPPPVPTRDDAKPVGTPDRNPLQQVQLNIPTGQTSLKSPTKPDVSVVAGGGMLSAEDLAKSKADRDARAAGKKKQQVGGPITDRFVKAVFATYPNVPTVPTRIALKDFTVEKETVNAIFIEKNTILNQLKSNLSTQEDKKGKQPRAKKALNGLLYFTKNNVIQPEQIKQVAELVVLILNIDPLLITTADAVLRQLGFTDVAVHNLMTLFFEERVRFIQETLEELKKQATEGAIQDIDEAFAYSIALSGELGRQESVLLDEHGTAAQKQEAQVFIDRVKELRKTLCAILLAPENIVLFNNKPALQALYHMICGQQQKGKLRVYCVSAKHTYGAVLAGKRENEDYTYCGFDQEIKRILEEIYKYNQLKASELSTSQRVYTVQTIIGSLQDINTFFSNEDVCPNCLRGAIVTGHPGSYESRQVAEPFKQQLADIGDFLLTMNKRDNSFYLEDFVRAGIPKIKATLERVRRYDDDTSQAIYGLIGINRLAREKNLAPYSIEDYRQGSIPRQLIQEAEERRKKVLSL